KLRRFPIGLAQFRLARRTRAILAVLLARRMRLAAATAVAMAASAPAPTATAAAAMVTVLKAELHRGHVVELRSWNGLADQRLDGGDGLAVLGCRDRVGAAVASRPAGAADAVDVILGVMGHVEIEHVR